VHTSVISEGKSPNNRLELFTSLQLQIQRTSSKAKLDQALQHRAEHADAFLLSTSSSNIKQNMYSAFCSALVVNIIEELVTKLTVNAPGS
jgi:hypothetical protein